MIRKLLASATIVATILVVAPATAQAAQQPVVHYPSAGSFAPHHRLAPPAATRDLSYAKGTGLRKCVATTYRARVWHTVKTRPGESCVWQGLWYPASWRVLEAPVFYAGMWWPVMQAPPRGGWHGHKPADASWWPGRASALGLLG